MSLVQAPHLKKPVFGAPERVYIFDKKSRFDRMLYYVTIDLTCKYLSKTSNSKVIISVFHSFPVSI